MSKWQMRLWAINHFASAACDCSVQLTVYSHLGLKQDRCTINWDGTLWAKPELQPSVSAAQWAPEIIKKKSGSALSTHAVICNSWLHRQTVCLSVKRISLKPKITWNWQETQPRKLENEPTCLGSFKVLIKNAPFPCREPPLQRTSKELFRKKGKRRWGGQKWGETQRDINKQIAHPSCLSSSSACLSLLLSPKWNSWWLGKGDSQFWCLFCSGVFCFFWRNWGNKLDRDLSNQNSLQKLSDPGGSRALDKQGWLFQRHAYTTYIWARDVTRRRLRQTKPGSHPKCFVRKCAQINGLCSSTSESVSRGTAHKVHGPRCVTKHDAERFWVVFREYFVGGKEGEAVTLPLHHRRYWRASTGSGRTQKKRVRFKTIGGSLTATSWGNELKVSKGKEGARETCCI